VARFVSDLSDTEMMVTSSKKAKESHPEDDG
jgi:hypothetical protein